jgi:riboflavin kinase/FMN adenylyltransferase
MNSLHAIPELAKIPGPLFLAIGVFDGLHLGHQAVIRRAREDARERNGTAAVVTFHPHPERVLSPETAPRLLTSTRHKQLLLRRLGIEWTLIIEFTREFANTEPAEFVRDLARHAQQLGGISVGREWTFGKGARGDVLLLRELGKRHNFRVHGVEPVRLEGQVVSSTRIREFIRQGQFEEAEKLLGRHYTLYGTVTRGAGLGRQLGFPTANLSTHNELFPPDGVYAVRARRPGSPDAPASGSAPIAGIANLGWRPTLNTPQPRRLLEVHLFDFDEDLYDQQLEVRFHGRIRPERKFAGLDELKERISRDCEQARRILAEH